MYRTNNLREKPVKKLFFSYLIPAVFGMLLMSVNTMTDAIMVSRGIGDEALAGVNIAFPAFSIFYAISLWISMGGATLYSIALGENKITHARSIFSQSMIISVLMVCTLSALALWQIENIAYLFGANPHILPYTLDYLYILFGFGFIYVLENVLSTFIRNDGNPNLAMIGLVVTALLNILLNYLFIFIFHWGVPGSAWATIISAGIGFCVLLSHFFKKDRVLNWASWKLEWPQIKQIMLIGFPSFTAEITVAISTVCFNIAFMQIVGEMGVTAFAIVNSFHSITFLLFFGIGAALQPIVSFHHGANLTERLQECLQLAIRTAIILGGIAIILIIFCGKYIVTIFDIQSPELLQTTVTGMSLFFLQYVFLGYNIVYGEYFQSISQTKKSFWIIISRGLLFVLPLLWIMSTLWGIHGIWLSMPLAELLTAMLIFITTRFQFTCQKTVSFQDKE